MRGKKSAPQETLSGNELTACLQDIVDGVEDDLIIIDADHRVKLANFSAKAKTHEKTSPIGKACYEVFHGSTKPCSTTLWDCPLRQVLTSGQTTTFIHPTTTYGTNKYVKITAYPLKDHAGNPVAMVELRREVTAERQLESQILRRHHQLQALSNISGAVASFQDLDSILKTALDNVLSLIKGAIGGILLLDEETKTLSYHTQRGLSARYADEMRMALGEGIAGRVAQTGEPVILADISRDPRTIRTDLVNAEGLHGFISIPLKSKDKIIGVMNIASHEEGHFGSDDLSLLRAIGDYLGAAIEQARLYERLKKAGERYQTLLQHSLTAQEEERKRIARELHDETSQAITSLTLSLQALIQIAEMKGITDTEFVDKLKKAHSNAVLAGTEIVKLMKELRPTLLDELGLSTAIQRYARDTLEAKGIELCVDFQGTDKRLPPEIEVTLFRIAQGAIGNIREHSGAKKASITFHCQDSECILRIEDDGKGFEVSKLTRIDPRGRGAGLFTMKERVKLIGGVCHIESQPGAGTKVIIQVPLAKDGIHEAD